MVKLKRNKSSTKEKMTKKQQSKLKGLNLKKNNNEDHSVFTGAWEKNKERKKRNDNRWYNAHIQSTRATCNEREDEEELTKIMEEIFWLLKTTAHTA